MIRPEIETEYLLLSITKNCETLIEQTHRKSEETLDFKMIKSRETFHINPLISIERSWMIGLTDLEVYNTISNIRQAKKINLDFVNFLKKNLVVFHMEKSEMTLKGTWMFQVVQPPIYKTIL